MSEDRQGRCLDVVDRKRDLVLAQLPPFVPRDVVEELWEPLLEAGRAVLASPISSVQGLQTLDVGAFLETTGHRVMAQLAAAVSDPEVRSLDDFWGWYLEGTGILPLHGLLYPERQHLRFWVTLAPEQRQAALAGEALRVRMACLKLAAGDLILYPASSLHHVTPVTSGERLASFFWVQSMIRDDAQRRVLFDLDAAVQRLVAELGQGHASVVALTGTYHNLLRMWVEV